MKQTLGKLKNLFISFLMFLWDAIRSRETIMRLALNDFKGRFASSYFGVVWAYVTPLVTMLVLWFVFQVGIRSENIGDHPFIVWFAPSYLLWAFFSETLAAGTNSIREYSFLVRKLNFRVSIVPLVKILSGCFVHLAFIGFLFFLNVLYGVPFSLYNLQILYYFFCCIFLLLGLCWLTSAITPFFSDMQSIVSILIQIGFWATPIVWNADNLINPLIANILKLNPMFYICRGYRDAMVDNVWFWERGFTNLSFWLTAMFFFVIGALVFNRLRSHFADVL